MLVTLLGIILPIMCAVKLEIGNPRAFLFTLPSCVILLLHLVMIILVQKELLKHGNWFGWCSCNTKWTWYLEVYHDFLQSF